MAKRSVKAPASPDRNTEETKVPWKEELRANLRVFGLAVSSAPVLASFMMFLTLLEGLVPAVIISQTGRLLNVLPAAVAREPGAYATARSALFLVGFAIAGSQVVKPIKGAFQYGVGRKFVALLARRVMAGVTSTPGIAHFEDPAFRDKLEISDWISWAPANNVQQVAGMIQQTIQVIALAAIAGAYAGWVPVLLFATALPAGFAAFNRVKSQGIVMWQDSPEVRRASYYRTLALDLVPAKEIRLFGLKDWVSARQDHHWLNGFRETWRKRRQGNILVMALHVVAVAALALAYWTMLQATLDGRMQVGTFAAAAMAAVQILTATIGIFSIAAWMRRINYMLPYVMRLFDLGARDPRMVNDGTKSAHGLVPTGIGFEGVRFRYPGTERWILDGLDLHIEAGQSLALVGENGAGKTTLIKLLCRFYDPTEGRITLDGVDIREFDLADLRRRIACIFQDFARYELAARDNIGFGAVDHKDDLELIREAAKRVGVLDEIESLPDGWDTPLSRAFDGVDLSGGQWQRIALARAMFAQLGNGADLLILDEPTASLDVRLEHELYEHFAEIASGRTTLLVSHRFSTVRMAERIVFLEAGRVVEDGSHASLMTSGGRYAELYRLQAEHYVATGALE